jgi:ribonuclease G
MAEEILIAVSEFETRVALLRAGSAQEIHLARADGYSLTGNVYLGKVARIIPGMQAAFVDVGLERPGFLHARDIEGSRLIRSDEADPADDPRPADIRDLLHEGQQVMVQIAKDPISGKGARLTTALAIASRYMVLMPFNDHVGISQRIDDETERERLKLLIEEVRLAQGIGMGFIARTAAEGVERDAVDLDIRVLTAIWDRLLEKKRASGCPALLYEELPLHIRMVRDLVGPDTQRIVIDHQDTFRRVHSFVSEFIPAFAERLVNYREPRSLFQRYGVDEEISRALNRKVDLKNGGHLIIEQTEAMITVDVNTGGYLGGTSHEETVYRTNLEAAQMIPRQLRLRNLGGIVVIDFIDMEEEEHRRQVLRVLEKACEADPARIRLDGFSMLGLVQLSRKRTRESLLQQVCEPCSQCDGLGVVKTAASTCVEIFRSILEDANLRCESLKPEGNYLIRTGSEVVDRLLDEDARFLAALAEQIGREISMQIEPSYGPGEYDVVLVQDMRRPG